MDIVIHVNYVMEVNIPEMMKKQFVKIVTIVLFKNIWCKMLTKLIDI